VIYIPFFAARCRIQDKMVQNLESKYETKEKSGTNARGHRSQLGLYYGTWICLKCNIVCGAEQDSGSCCG
jgi:hypothetical protein